MKRIALIVAAVLGVLLVLGFGADRAAAAAAERTITERVSADLSGVPGVSTQIHGVPVLTQVAKGQLDHVTVSAPYVPASGITLQDVVVDLYGVTTSAPRTAQTVEATALLPTEQLAKKLGDGWTVTADGDGLIAAHGGLLSAEARVVPTVTDGALALDLDWVKILGVQVDGSSVPSVVTDAIASVVKSVGPLPFGLELTSVQVQGDAVVLNASAADVSLE